MPLSFKLAQKLVLTISVLSFIMIIFGATVRISDAGLSCPDWPLCLGQLVPLFDTKVFLEWFHRLIAGFISILFLGLFLIGLLSADLKKNIAKPLLLGALLLSAQVILGGLTVLWQLKHQVVVGHLVIGYAFFSSQVFIFLKLKKLSSEKVLLAHNVLTQTVVKNFSLLRNSLAGKWAYRYACWGLFAVAAQVFFGGLVSSNYAGLACSGFPLCHAGQWFPEAFYTGTGLHSWHRIWAITWSIVLLVSLSIILLKITLPKLISGILKAQFLVFGFQFLLGLIMFLTGLPLVLRIAHAATSLTLYTLYFVGVYVIYHYRLPEAH